MRSCNCSERTEWGMASATVVLFQLKCDSSERGQEIRESPQRGQLIARGKFPALFFHPYTQPAILLLNPSRRAATGLHHSTILLQHLSDKLRVVPIMQGVSDIHPPLACRGIVTAEFRLEFRQRVR